VEEYAVSEDKNPSGHSQILFPPWLDALKRSSVWHREQEVLTKLRAKLSAYTPEQLLRLRTTGLPRESDLAPELVEQLRRRHEQPSEEFQPGVKPEPAQQQPEQPEQPEQEIGSTPEQAEQLPQPKLNSAAGGRPPIEFAHLEEALVALENNESLLQAKPKKQRDFVIKFLREHDDKVEDNQDKTIGRRINERRSGQNSKP
jgi:hypothetical protein